MTTAYVILNVGRVRVTLAAIRALYPANPAQMPYVIIEVFRPFEGLSALIAVQAPGVVKTVGASRAMNLSLLIMAQVPRVDE